MIELMCPKCGRVQRIEKDSMNLQLRHGMWLYTCECKWNTNETPNPFDTHVFMEYNGEVSDD